MAMRTDRIFLCHASEDTARVIDLHGTLERAGLHPWIDKEDIPPASDWDREIAKTIQAARFVVICFSRHLALKTGYVQRELDMALQAAKSMPADKVFLIPVRLDECNVADRFSHLPYIDLFDEIGVAKIVEVIKAELRLFTDPRDGQVYRTVVIGDQTWLAENLNYETAGSWWYDDDPSNARPYGRLYTWQAALTACPPGWHIPDDGEWQQLAFTLGGCWDGPNTDLYKTLIDGGKSGFDAVLGGTYDSRPVFKGFHEKLTGGYYWAATSEGRTCVFAFSAKAGQRLFRLPAEDHDENGYSCRCVRNPEFYSAR